MSLYYRFSLGDASPCDVQVQNYDAAVEALYFHGDAPDLVDRARILELQAQHPDLNAWDSFTVWTDPVPNGAVIQRGDPSVVTPDEAREEQALEQMIAWANEFTPWALWLFEIIGTEADGYSVPGDGADLCWRDGQVVVRPDYGTPDDYEFYVPGTAGAKVEVDGQPYELAENMRYTVSPYSETGMGMSVELYAQVTDGPDGTEIWWRIDSEDLRAWGEAKDWSKGLVGILDLDDD